MEEIDQLEDGKSARLNWVVALLYLGMILMGIAIIAMVLAALIVGTENGLRESLFSHLDAETLPPMGQLALACLGSAVTAAAWLVVLRMLLKVVRTVQVGDPFVEDNINRLRWMWIIIAVTELFRMLIYSFADLALTSESMTRVDNGIDINLGTWFLVAVVAALSEAFRHGAKLRRDQELTI